MVNDTLTATVESHRVVLNSVWQAMRLRLTQTGLENSLNVIPRPDLAEYAIHTDPFEKTDTLIGVWKDERGTRLGEIQIRADGSVYAEVDVVRNHPKDVRWFVEAVTAWGQPDALKTELRLLPAI